MESKYSVLLLFLGLLIGACDPSLETICHTQLPDFQKQMEVASQEIGRFHVLNRALASGEEGPQYIPSGKPYTLDDQETWEKWALDHLNELQNYIDRMDRNPDFEKAKHALKLAANETVIFHGYATQGNSVKMVEQLDRIQEQAEILHQQVCSPKS